MKKIISLLIFLSLIQSVNAQESIAQDLQESIAQDLSETFQLALENDPALQEFYYRQFSAAESKSQRIAQMLPTISVSGDSSRNRVDSKKHRVPQVRDRKTIGNMAFLSILLNRYIIGSIG